MQYSAIISLFFIISFQVFPGDKQFTVEEIFGSSKFASRSIRGIQWMNDGRSYCIQELDSATKSTGIFRVTVADRQKELIISGSRLRLSDSDPAFRFTSYQFSPDGRRILFVSAPPEKQYLSRLTPAGNLFLYDLTTKIFVRITNVSVPQYNQKFSPDGKRIGYVRENNIFVYDIETGTERQLTSDGTEHIINGRFDWVYEEEFGISDGWLWSPDGKKIAFWKLDENRVPEYTMTEWDAPHLDMVTMRYPKPGDPNSRVALGVIDVVSASTQWIDLGANDDIYIPRMKWTKDKNILSFQKLNREQNTLELLYFNTVQNKIIPVLTERSDTWVEVQDDLRFLNDGSFVWSSERDGFNHLYLHKSDGTLLRQITSGAWDVDAFYGINEKTGTVYFTSSESTPIDRQIYSVKLDGSKKKQLSKRSGTHSANFSPSFETYIGWFSNVSTPTKVKMMDNNGTEMYSMEENEMPVLSEYALGNTEFFTMTTSDGMTLHASLLKPSNFDPSKKYAVLVNTYGGPGSQVVRNSWGGANYYWYSMLAEKGYLVFMVDNRGTGARGKAFKSVIYKDLGKWEVHDQIEGVKFLSTLPFVDRTRIGIWGWSYGGYIASLSILNGAEYFKTAIAVAPVTHWKFYDNIYTERYMGTPSGNPEGYTNSAPLHHTDKLKGNFLLVHGTADDNVHFQNAVTLVSALQQSNKQFRTMFYPNKNHGIAGGLTRVHLYTLMTEYLLQNL
jgi:dipeptidyl-peptidase-4